jgi:hypothetical protein
MKKSDLPAAVLEPAPAIHAGGVLSMVGIVAEIMAVSLYRTTDAGRQGKDQRGDASVLAWASRRADACLLANRSGRIKFRFGVGCVERQSGRLGSARCAARMHCGVARHPTRGLAKGSGAVLAPTCRP